MGSLTSRPKSVSGQPQIVFVPPSAPSSSSGASSEAASQNIESGAQADNASEARANSLLQRNRGRFGTVQTGFRGLLGLISDSGKRKTLLGE